MQRQNLINNLTHSIGCTLMLLCRPLYASLCVELGSDLLPRCCLLFHRHLVTLLIFYNGPVLLGQLNDDCSVSSSQVAGPCWLLNFFVFHLSIYHS